MPHLLVPFDALPVPVSLWKQKALAWAEAKHEVVAYYTSNDIRYRHNAFKNILGVQEKAHQEASITSLKELHKVLEQQQARPLLGYFTYDLKNDLEKLSSQNPDHIIFPPIFFFYPAIWLEWETNHITIHTQSKSPEEVLEQINLFSFSASFPEMSPKMQPRVPKEKYLQTVERLRQHILEGDVYEVNYCQEFYAEKVKVEPVSLFQKLNAASPTPFAGFLKVKDKYLLCASPERFLKKESDVLISQPIKGTIARGKTPEQDESQRQALASSEKEQAENMMIVDLVRNDLNRVAATGSVQVEELFGLYGFQYVWQMISTVVARLPQEINTVEAIKAAFPMGSMTGAPKIKALELIEAYEDTKRGLYSGSLGYFLPSGDFDFNVVIRSLQYNAGSGYLSFEVGSAITYDSDPAQEYQECLLKAAAILKVLQF